MIVDSDCKWSVKNRFPVFEPSVRSFFSSDCGVVSPEEWVKIFCSAGYFGLSLSDLNTFLGSFRGYFSSKELGLPFFISTRFRIGSKTEVLCFPLNLDQFRALCGLISKLLTDNLTDNLSVLNCLTECFSGNAVILVGEEDAGFEAGFKQFRDSFQEVVVGVPSFEHSPFFFHGKKFADRHKLKLINCLNFGARDNLDLQVADIRSSVWRKSKIGSLINTPQIYISPSEYYRLFRGKEELIKNGLAFAETLPPDLLRELKQEFPSFSGSKSDDNRLLQQLCFEALHTRKLGRRHQEQLVRELELIMELDYARFFLFAWDLVKFAREQGILCQGRGAAANSIVCYLLGITCVHPDEIDMLFSRFVNKERNEPPDIDIDFDSSKRDLVFDYLSTRYPNQSALLCNVVTYRLRSALREIGRVFGIPIELLNKLGRISGEWGQKDLTPDLICSQFPNLDYSFACKWLQLSKRMTEIPHYLGQHVGGVLINQPHIAHLSPIFTGADGRRLIQLAKDDVDELGFVKLDCLGLKMLSVLHECFNRVPESESLRDTSDLRCDDPAVFSTIASGDTVGIFQVESRAQMAMVSKLKPKDFYDLVIEVAIVRPGPIVGEMVHPYLRRRLGLEKVSFPDEQIRSILGKTLGVPIFQEQVLRIAKEVVGLSDRELELLRRALRSNFRTNEVIQKFSEIARAKMVALGYTVDFAEAFINHLKGFSEYGFPESHAASFAKLVYVSGFFKTYYPEIFYSALINNQPVGFYNTRQLCADARKRGLVVLEVDINKSELLTEPFKGGFRLGFNTVKGLRISDIETILKLRSKVGFFRGIEHFLGVLAGYSLNESTVSNLILAGAFDFQSKNRKQLLELALSTKNFLLQLSVPKSKTRVKDILFYDFTFKERSHSLAFSFIKRSLGLETIDFSEDNFKKLKPKQSVQLFGLCSIKQKPHTANGVIFLTLEDDSGFVNVVVQPDLAKHFKQIILSEDFLFIDGIFQGLVGNIPYVLANRISGKTALVDEFLKS